VTDRFVLVPASYVYLLREGDAGTEVLLQLRQGTPYMDGHWAAAAAGHVERGETAYDAARREALEELGVTDVSLDLEFTMQRTQHGEAIDERVDWFFTARSWTGAPRVVEPDKAAAVEWFPLSGLPEPMVPHEAYALAHLSSGAVYLTFGF
jgi:8-oxo-dGTP diphosphatase